MFIDCLLNSHAINGEYNANALRQLQKYIKIKFPGKLTKGSLFHQVNVPGHKSLILMATLHECSFEQVDHTDYSDLTIIYPA